MHIYDGRTQSRDAERRLFAIADSELALAVEGEEGGPRDNNPHP